jgi:hypothetical protein
MVETNLNLYLQLFTVKLNSPDLSTILVFCGKYLTTKTASFQHIWKKMSNLCPCCNLVPTPLIFHFGDGIIYLTNIPSKGAFENY